MIFVASLVQFILGALWYSPIMFGKKWMVIMGASNCTKEELQKMQKQMTPFYLLQFVLTIVFTWELSHVLGAGTLLNPYFLAFATWIGFIVPIQVSGVIWGSTKKEFWLAQILIMTSYQLVGIMLATWFLTM